MAGRAGCCVRSTHPPALFFCLRPPVVRTRGNPYTFSRYEDALLRLALVVALAFAALALVAPAAAQTGPRPPSPPKVAGISSLVVLWFVAGVGLGVIVMGTLYLFKRQVGGFPENPSWKPPSASCAPATSPVMTLSPDTATP